MLRFIHTMDQHSREIVRDGKVIGYLQWHPERPPGLYIHNAEGFTSFSITDMKAIIAEYEAIQLDLRVDKTIAKLQR